ncbi:MAG TPA: GYF domain-containing protein [Tepidisphaeraceae bacterium]|jgi:hypothetical protein|nr:GYF domain-containing protein [Tepidisphaeraceae bacterium]
MADWYYAQGTVQRGPVSMEFVEDSLRSGVLRAGDLVWRQGLADWTPAGQMTELAGAMRATFAPPRLPPDPPMAPLTPPPPAPSVQPQLPHAPGPSFGPAHSSPVKSPHSSLALTSMMLGLVAFILMPLGSMLGVPALVCGIIALRGMKQTGVVENRGMAIAGVALGIFWTVVGAMVVAAALLYLVLQPASFNLSTSSSPPTHAPYLMNP